MSAPNLPFLWPMLFRPAKSARTHVSRAKGNAPRTRQARRCMTTTPCLLEQSSTQRYGKAYEHAASGQQKPATRKTQEKGSVTAGKPSQGQVPGKEDVEGNAPAATSNLSTHSKPSTSEEKPIITPPPETLKANDNKPLDSVLHIPTAAEEESHKPPHLKTPPYVHHFDTYGLVRKLSQSSYTPEQSITIMKAVRQTLLSNMALAREGLVSKSNVENETYLFRAACSELKTEIGNARKGEMERMRQERGQLQHEVDILGQRLSQETGGLKDELKGLFDDRKMAVRMEQRAMETKVCFASIPSFEGRNTEHMTDVRNLRSKNSTTKSPSRSTLMRARKSRRCAGCLRGAQRLQWGFRRSCCLWRYGIQVMCSIRSKRRIRGSRVRRRHIGRIRWRSWGVML